MTEPKISITLNSILFIEACRAALISAEKSGVRSYLKHINLVLTRHALYLQSTDGHRATKVRLGITGNDEIFNVLVGIEYMAPLVKNCPLSKMRKLGHDDTTTVVLDETHLTVQNDIVGIAPLPRSKEAWGFNFEKVFEGFADDTARKMPDGVSAKYMLDAMKQVQIISKATSLESRGRDYGACTLRVNSNRDAFEIQTPSYDTKMNIVSIIKSLRI